MLEIYKSGLFNTIQWIYLHHESISSALSQLLEQFVSKPGDFKKYRIVDYELRIADCYT